MKIISKIKCKLFYVMLFGVALMTLLNACKKSNAVPALQTSNLMVVNAFSSPTSTPVYFFLDTQRVNTAALAYGNTPAYYTVLTGYSNGTFKNATSFANSTTTYAGVAPSLSLVPANSYSAFLYGNLASPTVLFTQDTLSAPPSGKARIRLVNLGQNEGTNVDLALLNAYKTPAVSNVILPNNTYGSASKWAVVDTCSNYTIQLLATGTTTIKASSSKLSLLPNLNYTILIKGISGGTPAIAIQAPINNSVY